MNFMFIRARYNYIQFHPHSRRVAMVWNDMQWYSYSLPFLLLNDMQGYVLHSHTLPFLLMQWYARICLHSHTLPFLLMQTFWMDTHCMDTYWWDMYWTDTYWWDMYWWDTFAIPADAHLLNGYALTGYASHGYVLVGYMLNPEHRRLIRINILPYPKNWFLTLIFLLKKSKSLSLIFAFKKLISRLIFTWGFILQNQ